MSPSPANLQVAQVSDTGRARSHNEDFVDHYVPRDGDQLATKGAIYLVADGMGGHQAGEVASRAAVEFVIDQYYRDVQHDVASSLVRAYRAANRMIYDQAQSDPSKGGMGTTLVAAVVVGSKVYVASVGDSRVYILGPNRAAQITEDHSWVQEQVRAGLLTPEQARQHPQRNVVTRALGSKPSVEVDLFEGQLSEGESLLLCSDGLSGLVSDAELQSIVQAQPPEEAARTLVSMANERGGTDNITVLIVSNRPQMAPKTTVPLVEPEVPKVRGAAAGRGRGVPLLPILAVLIGLAALAAVAVFVVLPLLKGEKLSAADMTATATAAGGTLLTSPVVTPTVAPTSTAILPSTEVTTGTPLPPTVTLIPTRTPSAIPPAATSAPTKPALSPALTPGAGATPVYPAPALVSPSSENAGSLRGNQLFEWSFSESLKPGEGFQVLIWKQGQADNQGANAAVTTSSVTINLDILLPTRGGEGPYFWSVVVVRISDNLWLSPRSKPWQFTYTGPQGGSPGATSTSSPPAATSSGSSRATVQPISPATLPPPATLAPPPTIKPVDTVGVP